MPQDLLEVASRLSGSTRGPREKRQLGSALEHELPDAMVLHKQLDQFDLHSLIDNPSFLSSLQVRISLMLDCLKFAK